MQLLAVCRVNTCTAQRMQQCSLRDICVASCLLPAGVQLAKMTPFRSYVVIHGSCVAAVFGKAVGLDSFPVYISVRPLLMQQIMAVDLGAFYSLLCSCQISLRVKHSLMHSHATTTSDRDMQNTMLSYTNRPQASCHIPVLHCCLTSRPELALCLQVSAIVAVGATEGIAHVNWNKYLVILAWWYLGCIPLFAITALFNWQGD